MMREHRQLRSCDHGLRCGPAICQSTGATLTAADHSVIESAQMTFERSGAVEVTWLFTDDVRRAVAAEALALANAMGTRRNLSIRETDFTPRRMANVRACEILQRSELISTVYNAVPSIHALVAIAQEHLHVCPYEPEQVVITRLERAGDTHGWHWDDYSFALVWVADCPDPADGGFVEYVPATTWDKRRPGIAGILRDRPIHRLEVGTGAVYLMRANTTLHRVHPIRRGRRTIVNMAFASEADLARPATHETMDSLWAT
ncbi:HalD/BesD family halogenase [Nocardia salmonicida]|uniref:HalD/BesD family halogenase n=1 Tax=Nocardia salmonicida TaxID=53431 RepID=UPI003CF24C9E